uniref:Uncharacterized protein n=1 Tax=Triticum urartu TaxID=4572 RepID=A0A8R7R0Q4_TRIUA
MEEEGVVMPPPVVVVVEEEVVQPPPMLEEEEDWVTVTLGHAEQCRHLVAAGVENVIACSQAARVTLLEVAAVLRDDPIDAAETIYTDLLEAVSRGMDSLLLGPAAQIVDNLFNWPGPLAGAIDVATVLLPDAEPLEKVRRELQLLVDVVHDEAGHFFTFYTDNLGLAALPGGEGAYNLWVLDHLHADDLAREALQALNVAVERSLAADLDVRFCGIMPASRVRPGAGPLLPLAVQRLNQTVTAVDDALTALDDMRDTLVELEQSALNVIGQDPPPP